MEMLNDIGEVELIERFSRFLPIRDDILVSVGDDCAVIRTDCADERDLLLTSDSVIEGIHFRRDTPAKAVGHKAVGRALSDIAAMGGEPRWGLVDIAAPSDASVRRLEDIYRGLTALAGAMGLAIVGGDVAESKILQLHVFAVGVVPRGAAALRSGADESDSIFVTGYLGGSLAGKHAEFTPRVHEGVWLRDWATAMIDLSDGLATDLRHVMDASNVGAELLVEAIPVSSAAREADDDASPLDHALFDGEDFELLFTIPASSTDALLEKWPEIFAVPCTRIGSITANAGIVELLGPNDTRSELTGRGYEHFGGRT